MKRSGGIFLSAALLCGLCSCAANNAEIEQTESQQVLSVTEASGNEGTTTSAETEASEDTVTEPETSVPEETEETDITEPEFLPGEEILIDFLSYIQNGCEGYCPSDMGNYIGVYDFMNDFSVDGYSYEHKGDGVYNVTLTCSESSCDMFPDGDSYWYVNTNKYGNFIFFPAEKEDKVIFSMDMNDDMIKSAFMAAYNFSLYTNTFEADEEWFETYEYLYPHGFLDAYNPYVKANDYGGVLFEELTRATKKLYNVTIPDRAFDDLRESGTDEIICYGHGGSWLYDAFAGYDETDTEIKVRVEYYGDEFYFYPVVESEYTFSKNDDGTITLQRVQKLFDKEYEPARGSI